MSGTEYAIVVPDHDEAVRLHDMHLRVVDGRSGRTRDLRAGARGAGRMLATTCDDMQNTNVAFTARQHAPDLPIVATSSTPTAVDILRARRRDAGAAAGRDDGQGPGALHGRAATRSRTSSATSTSC
jgi:voltage-gated potassium channel